MAMVESIPVWLTQEVLPHNSLYILGYQGLFNHNQHPYGQEVSPFEKERNEKQADNPIQDDQGEQGVLPPNKSDAQCQGFGSMYPNQC
eukprot:6467241-Ditylum_brightwellii.AAC.1